MDANQLADFDTVFYYGQGELRDEIASDLLQILTQGKRSLFYSRSRNSAGVQENIPNSVSSKVLVPFDIISAISKRNDTTGNGQNGSRERRVATSQNQVKVEQKGSTADISVYYVPFFDINQKNRVGFQIGLNGRG